MTDKGSHCQNRRRSDDMEYISREEAVDAGYLSDWYISSVGDEPPVWTDAHIEELLNDFIVIPKDTKAVDVQPVKHGRWESSQRTIETGTVYCSNCAIEYYISDLQAVGDCNGIVHYCPNCGARMDGEQDD